MNAVLSTEFVEDQDYARAAVELLDNAERLIIGGCFEQAYAALALLTLPGPWKAGGHGRVTRALEALLPLACLLTGRPSPAIGGVPAMTHPQLATWAEDQAAEILDMLAMVGRLQAGPAGAGWSEPYLRALPAMNNAERLKQAFGDFLTDAEFILKERLANGGTLLPFLDAEALREELAGNPALAQLSGLLGNLSSPIQIAPAAREIPTGLIARTTAACMAAMDAPPHYLTDFIFHAATVLALREGELEEAAFAAGELAPSEMGRGMLVRSAVWPPVAALLGSSACAWTVGLDAATADQYLVALRRRQATLTAAPAATPAYAADTLAGFAEALAGTPLAGRELIDLPVLDTSECAYAIATNPQEMESLWQEARKLVDQTGRWPLLVTQWGARPGLPLKAQLLEEDLFSRFEYEEAPDAGDVSPRAILAAAETADVAAFIRRSMQHREETWRLDADLLEYELDATASYCGSAPAPEEVTSATLGGKPVTTIYELDRWLLDWERAHGANINLDDVRQEWFDPGAVVLLFLPTPRPWDALAYLSFFGSPYRGVENYIALGHQWQQRYGAELVAHFGTMLQCYVSRPPATQEEAWQLAVEQDIAASDTLTGPGISLRHHAAGLVGHGRWFLHQRP